MAETLRELVVALSLDSSNFSRNMRTINQQIKEAESTFRLAGAGVQNYEKTIAGTEAKLSMLGQKPCFRLLSERPWVRFSPGALFQNPKLTAGTAGHELPGGSCLLSAGISGNDWEACRCFCLSRR